MSTLDGFLHYIMIALGIELPNNAPDWVHPVLHLALIFTPLLFIVLIIRKISNYNIPSIIANIRIRATNNLADEVVPTGIYGFVYKNSRISQGVLLIGGVLSLPLLYASLELPKNIINKAIDAEEHTTHMFGLHLSQLDHLYILCMLYLLVIIANGLMKYAINIYRGKVSESMLLILRMSIFKGWCSKNSESRSTEIIPMVSQEVEPVGGFAGEAIATPVLQGGTFITIVFFMFVQNPILGAAAITLIPIQILVIPAFQRRLNSLTRARLSTMRKIGGIIGDYDVKDANNSIVSNSVNEYFNDLQSTRLEFHKTKFMMKFTNNLLIALTPFTFYSIGGYLVINGQLSLGALIAVLSAYKDLSSPLRELFRYYQTKEDVRVRYRELRMLLT